MRSGYLVAVYEFLSPSKHKLRTDLALLAFRTAVRDFVCRSEHDIVVTRLITSIYVHNRISRQGATAARAVPPKAKKIYNIIVINPLEIACFLVFLNEERQCIHQIM